MLEGVGVYKERLEKTISFDFSAEVIEKILRYLFEDYLLNASSKAKR
jgi:hypothetical protein